MSKHLSDANFIKLPSGSNVHLYRLIHRDGTLMWKNALINTDNKLSVPTEQAHEAHIIKTAQRIEELNTWVSNLLEPWDCIKPLLWYSPEHPHEGLANGYACYFQHTSLPLIDLYHYLAQHIQSHESLEQTEGGLYFSRC